MIYRIIWLTFKISVSLTYDKSVDCLGIPGTGRGEDFVPFVSSTGCARSQGYYKISFKEKTQYLGHARGVQTFYELESTDLVVSMVWGWVIVEVSRAYMIQKKWTDHFCCRPIWLQIPFASFVLVVEPFSFRPSLLVRLNIIATIMY